MCLLPFMLGIVPLIIFLFSHPDIYNVSIILKQAEKDDSIMFYKDEMYRIPNQENNRIKISPKAV